MHSTTLSIEFGVARHDIESFARQLEDFDRARATIAGRLCTVTALYRYAVDDGFLERSQATPNECQRRFVHAPNHSIRARRYRPATPAGRHTLIDHGNINRYHGNLNRYGRGQTSGCHMLLC